MCNRYNIGTRKVFDINIPFTLPFCSATETKNVIISLGAKGAALASCDGTFTTPAPKIKAVSTIGAGDSLIAGFMAATQAHRPPHEVLTFAVCCGSAACLTEGSKPPKAETVNALMTQLEANQA